MKLFSLFSIFNVVNSQMSVGGVRDDNNCIISAGYTWCDSSESCIRQWETPCSDNYNSCNDCLNKQRKGQNIACPTSCNMIQVDPMPIIDPPLIEPPMIEPPIRPYMPPTTIPTPTPTTIPTPHHSVCSEVMCMMYCENGHKLDENGCQMCACNEPGNEPGNECSITQPSCEGYTYVCPKITEITRCNEGGINGFTTFQLSLIINPSSNAHNIYAIYGDSGMNNNMYLPPSYQADNGMNSNIGGIIPYITSLDHSTLFDSWLTIGINDGNTNNYISSIGINFDDWTLTNGITIDNGAVFITDPEQVLVDGSEYLIAQITVRTGSQLSAVFNAQGKTINDLDRSWSENNIVFDLNSPQIQEGGIPNNCVAWFDGCNTCRVGKDRVLGACTRMMCFQEDEPRCLSYEQTSGH